MFGASTIAVVFAALLLPQAGSAPLDPSWVLEVRTPTYGTDGKVGGAGNGSRSLTVNQPLVLFPYSGKSLCDSASATRDLPPDIGNGWRVQVVPLRNAGGLVLQVDWERIWERGAKLTNGPRGKAQVTLHPGDRIVFDYISVGERALSPNMATEARTVTGRGCDAVGMALEVGLAPIERNEIVEANLWLVRTLPNGTEQSQHQTIRARAGGTAEYFFDDGSYGSFYYFNGPTVRTLGKLSSIDVVNGKVRLDLTIEQYLAGSQASPPEELADLIALRRGKIDAGLTEVHPEIKSLTARINALQASLPSAGRATGGSSTFRLDAGPDEVVSFQVPKITDDRLSLRIQVKQIR